MQLNNNFTPQFKQDQEYFGDTVGIGALYFKELDLPCQCGSHIMRIYRDEHGAGIAFYTYAPNSFRERLKKAWRLLFKGERALLDDIVMDNDNLEKLKEFLQ